MTSAKEILRTHYTLDPRTHTIARVVTYQGQVTTGKTDPLSQEWLDRILTMLNALADEGDKQAALSVFYSNWEA